MSYPQHKILYFKSNCKFKIAGCTKFPTYQEIQGIVSQFLFIGFQGYILKIAPAPFYLPKKSEVLETRVSHIFLSIWNHEINK